LALLQLAQDSDYDMSHLSSAKLVRLERLPLTAIAVGDKPRPAEVIEFCKTYEKHGAEACRQYNGHFTE
jgi:hypothetical protein